MIGINCFKKNSRVAEKSNGVVMRFDNILNSPRGDIAANLSYSFTASDQWLPYQLGKTVNHQGLLI